MAREGRVLTRTLTIETRQHDIAGYDLGEGPPRAALIFTLAVAALWIALIVVVLGPPRSPFLLPVYVVPPALIGIYGWQEDPHNPRRRRVTTWFLALRNLRHGQHPVLNLGRRELRRSERPSLMQRVGTRYGEGDPWALLMPWRTAQRLAGERELIEPDLAARYSSDTIAFAPRVQHYGVDAAIAYTERAEHRATRRARHRTGAHSAITRAVKES